MAEKLIVPPPLQLECAEQLWSPRLPLNHLQALKLFGSPLSGIAFGAYAQHKALDLRKYNQSPIKVSSFKVTTTHGEALLPPVVVLQN